MEILNGFDYLFSNTSALIFVFLGAVVGMVVGAIPGLSAAAAIAMIVPATFYLDPLSALGFLCNWQIRKIWRIYFCYIV